MKRLLVVWCAVAAPVSVFGLGIRLFDHDAFATARGDAFVATADNPSAIYYNPAGITQLPGQNARASVYAVDVHSEFDPAAAGVRGVETKNDLTPLPDFFYSFAPEKLPIAVGVGYYMPYGLSMEWPDTAPFRKVTTRGELDYHTLSGVLAWKVCPTLSISGGATYNYSEVDLRRGIAVPGDGFRFDGSDWDLGAVAGILWQPTAQHSFGASYRSETKMDYQGRSHFRPYPIPTVHSSAELPLPQVIIAGYSFRPTTNWNIEVDADWTDWEHVNTVVLKQGPLGRSLLPLNWDSSWALEAGVTRYFGNGLHVSAGYVYLEDSTPTGTYNPVAPDQDLHVFSIGVGGQHGPLSWDLAYQFTWGPGRNVAGSIMGPSVSGDYTFLANAVTASVGYRF